MYFVARSRSGRFSSSLATLSAVELIEHSDSKASGGNGLKGGAAAPTTLSQTALAMNPIQFVIECAARSLL